MVLKDSTAVPLVTEDCICLPLTGYLLFSESLACGLLISTTPKLFNLLAHFEILPSEIRLTAFLVIFSGSSLADLFAFLLLAFFSVTIILSLSNKSISLPQSSDTMQSNLLLTI